MKDVKKIVPIIGLIIIVILIIVLILINIKGKSEEPKLNELVNQNSQIVVDENGVPKYIDGNQIETKVENEDDVFTVLNQLKDKYGFQNANDVFEILSTDEVSDIKFYKLKQIYNGKRVFGNELVIAVDKDNKIISIQGNYVKGIDISTYSSNKLSDVKNKYIETLGTDNYLIDDGEEIIYVLDNKPIYAYLFNVYDVNNGNYILIINTKGEVITRISSFSALSFTGKGEDGKEYTTDLKEISILGSKTVSFEDESRNIKVFDGSLIGADMEKEDGSIDYGTAIFFLLSTSLKGTPIRGTYANDTITYNFFDYDNNNVLKSALVNLVNFQKIYDYYYNTFGRKSYDNKGGEIDIFVDVKEKPYGSDDLINAAWYGGDNKFFVIGSNEEGITLSSALDIVGHEFTHGVVEYTAGLVYKGESGALNESFADVMGSVIEGKNLTIGDDILLVRDMDNPNDYNDPAEKDGKYYFPTDSEYYNEDWYARYRAKAHSDKCTSANTNECDNGGVHYNSGVSNKAAALIYRNGGVDSLSELGRLYYQSLYFMTSTTDFEGAALAIISAAKSLGYSDEKIAIIKDAFIETKMLNADYTIKGTVTDDDGKVISGVSVKLSYKNSTINQFVYTDKDGNYEFSNVQGNEYTIKYDKAKYKDVSFDLTVDKDIVKDVELEKLDEDSSSDNIEVVFVLDVSHSMDDNDPNDIRKQIMSNLLSSMDSNYRVGIVTFRRNSSVVSNGIKDSDVNNKMLMTDVFNIANDDGANDNSGTNGRAGINSALKMFDDKDCRKYIIFLTDGADTVKEYDKENEDPSYSDLVDKAKKKGVRVLAIGLSSQVEATNLHTLSDGTNGKYYYADNNTELSSLDRMLFEEME